MFNISLHFQALFDTIKLFGLPKHKQDIVFYSEGEAYWPHLKGLVTSTLENTSLSICYITSSKNDPGLNLNHQRLKKYFIGAGHIRNYCFENLQSKICVLTMPDLGNFQIKRSKYPVHYVYVQHSLVSLHMVYRDGAFKNFDTVCAAGPHHVKELHALQKQSKHRKQEVYCLGYSRIDEVIKKYARFAEVNKSSKSGKYKRILLAPSWGSQCLIESGNAHQLIKTLLSAGHAVSLRPHHQTIVSNGLEVERIKKAFYHHDKFTYGSDLLDMKALFTADIMISDWSGVALEFALGLNKPVIFYDGNPKVNNSTFSEITITPVEVNLRDKIGFIWDNQSDILKIISSLHAHSKNPFDYRNELIFNLHQSDTVFSNKMVELNRDLNNNNNSASVS